MLNDGNCYSFYKHHVCTCICVNTKYALFCKRSNHLLFKKTFSLQPPVYAFAGTDDDAEVDGEGKMRNT